MAKRVTYIGTLYRENPAAAREEILRFLRRQKGVVADAARDAGLSRRNFIRYLHQESLWEELRRIRDQHPRPARVQVQTPPVLVTKARAALARHEGGHGVP